MQNTVESHPLFSTPINEQHFVDQIYCAIDQIRQARFVDNEIVLDAIGEDAAFFLDDQRHFKRIRNPARIIPGLLLSGITGLILRKNDDNSDGEAVKPGFIDNLNCKTETYFNLLSTGWEFHRGDDRGLVCKNNYEQLKFPEPHVNLNGMYDFYVQSNLLNPDGEGLNITGFYKDEVQIQGGEKEIQSFLDLLKRESAVHASSIAHHSR